MSDRLTAVGYAVLIGAGAWLLSPFLVVAFYSSPFTDDFCLSSQSFQTTIAEIQQYYFSVGGRLPAYVLITLPSDLAHVTALDLFVVYPIVVFAVLASFVVSICAAAVIVFGGPYRRAAILYGLCFCTLVLGVVPALDEFAYWMTGAACYLFAAMGACLYAAGLMRFALADNHVTSRAVVGLTAIGFVTTALNEFTVFFLFGVTVIALAARLILTKKLAATAPCWPLLLAICAGYMVIVLAPGNAYRLSLFSGNRDFFGSIDNASLYTLQDAVHLFRLSETRAFAVLTACFAVATAGERRHPFLSLAVGCAIFVVAIVWAYTSYFIGAYSTGDTIALRARSEILVVLAFACAIFEIILIQVVIGRRWQLPAAYRFALLVVGTLFILPVRHAANYEAIRTQWPQLATFWQESMTRNRFISSATQSDVVVSRRTVFPSLLMGGELKETPGQLPNDCIARLYGKSSIVLEKKE